MKLFKCLALTIGTVFFILSGCEEDVLSPVAKAPFPVVHCILNAYDTAHYVRLTKTFSGGYDAYEMAQNIDSLYFRSARVFFDVFGLSQNYSIELEPTWEVNRQPGIFPVDSLLLYKTKEKISGVRLRIEIPEINTTVLGSGGVGGHPLLILPKPGTKKELAFFESEPVMVRWQEYPEGISETIIRFHYETMYPDRTAVEFLDWKRSSAYFAIVANDYLKFLSNWIHEDPKVEMRKVLGIDIIITAGPSTLKDYLNKNDWAIDVIDKPWSNLFNAYGIISFIGRDTLTGYFPNQKFMDSLANGPMTKHLRFVNWLSPNL